MRFQIVLILARFDERALFFRIRIVFGKLRRSIFTARSMGELYAGSGDVD